MYLLHHQIYCAQVHLCSKRSAVNKPLQKNKFIMFTLLFLLFNITSLRFDARRSILTPCWLIKTNKTTHLCYGMKMFICKRSLSPSLFINHHNLRHLYHLIHFQFGFTKECHEDNNCVVIFQFVIAF